MSDIWAWPRKLLGFFVADTGLAIFVPVWIAFAWFCKLELPHTPPAAFAALLACGPIAALWWSVRHAARALRRSGSNPQ